MGFFKSGLVNFDLKVFSVQAQLLNRFGFLNFKPLGRSKLLEAVWLKVFIKGRFKKKPIDSVSMFIAGGGGGEHENARY